MRLPRHLPVALLAGLALAPAARADVPSVAVDIAPVHSLVAQVMGDLGSPALVVPPTASPHGHALRPSEARALAEADLVVWVGPALSPWLEEPIETLAPDAAHLALLEAVGAQVLPAREIALFEHDHGEGEHGEEDHAHEDVHGDEHGDEHGHEDEHAHEDEHGHEDDHADEHAHEDEHGHEDDHGHDDHAQGGVDPHLWLDPQVGQAILDVVAGQLSTLDPENAGTYAANAAAATAALSALERDLDARLAPVRDTPFVVAHDAFQYFEARFDLTATGAVAASDAQAPGAARLVELRDALAGGEVACLFSEPVGEGAAAQMLAEDAGLGLGLLDPIGVDIPTGPGQYAALLGALADGIVDCLSG